MPPKRPTPPKKHKNRNTTTYTVPKDPVLAKTCARATYLVNYSRWITDVWKFYINNEVKSAQSYEVIADRVAEALKLTRTRKVIKQDLNSLRTHYPAAYKVLIELGGHLLSTIGGAKLFKEEEKDLYTEAAKQDNTPYKKNVRLMIKLINERAANEKGVAYEESEVSESEEEVEEVKEKVEEKVESKESKGATQSTTQKSTPAPAPAPAAASTPIDIPRPSTPTEEDEEFSDWDIAYPWSPSDGPWYPDIGRVMDHVRLRQIKPNEDIRVYINKMANRLNYLYYRDASLAREYVFPMKVMEGLKGHPVEQKRIAQYLDRVPAFFSNEEVGYWLIDVCRGTYKPKPKMDLEKLLREIMSHENT